MRSLRPWIPSGNLANAPDAEESDPGADGFPAKEGHIRWFELAGSRFENVEAIFSLAKTGQWAGMYLDGLVGEGVLQHFNVIFDYTHSRAAFWPGGHRKIVGEVALSGKTITTYEDGYIDEYDSKTGKHRWIAP